MSLGGTLIVAVVGGSVGSGLAIAGGLVSQTRQHRFEHDRWVLERMERAAVRFDGLALRAYLLLHHTAAWGDIDGAKELRAECLRQSEAIGAASSTVYMAFGGASRVYATADDIDRDVLDSARRITLLAGLDPIEGIYETAKPAPPEPEEILLALSRHRVRFVREARVAIFLRPRHKRVTRDNEDEFEEPE